MTAPHLRVTGLAGRVGLLGLLGAAAALGAAGVRGGPAAPAAAPGAAAAAEPVAAPAPLSWLERWGWNPRERTARGLARRERGDDAAAAEALDTAWSLAPSDPLAAYNAGTGRLAAGRPDAAGPLARAAREAPPGLAADAFYNLGNARLGARDARGAIDAYVETLRRAPERADAKHNLELALRALEDERRQHQQQEPPPPTGDSPPQPSPSAGESGEPEEEPSEPDERAEPSNPPSSPGDADGERPPPPAGAPPPPTSSPGDPQGRPSPLPQFKDVPEMNAEQAAALLAAVENLEREARRERSRQRAGERAEVERDW